LPHIVFDKKIDLFVLSKNFGEIFQKTPFLIKISSIFIERNGLSALLPTVAIDDLHQDFLIEISTRKLKTTIRLYPQTDPVKTDGVKSSIALLSKYILKIFPNLKITQTNLLDYLTK
jgi:hypothetical protein